MIILAIESSCDETAVALVKDGQTVISSAVNSQIAIHRSFGGVVPEIASRQHCENIVAVTNEALEKGGLSLNQIDAVAVTYTPGLIGALLVGVNYAKGLCLSLNKPLIPVHHIKAHIAANYIVHNDLKPPYLALVISGGHSHIIEVLSYTSFKILGRTRDDAAGEAYDKAARALELPYPGGIEIDRLAKQGTPSYHLPRPSIDGFPLDFSFSGLKTAVLNIINNSAQKGVTIDKANLAASFQLAMCDIISDRVLKAAQMYGYKIVALAGGVAANSGIRERLSVDCEKNGYKLFLPSIEYCGDNGAMVGVQAFYEYQNGIVAGFDLNAVASTPIS